MGFCDLYKNITYTSNGYGGTVLATGNFLIACILYSNDTYARLDTFTGHVRYYWHAGMSGGVGGWVYQSGVPRDAELYGLISGGYRLVQGSHDYIIGYETDWQKVLADWKAQFPATITEEEYYTNYLHTHGSEFMRRMSEAEIREREIEYNRKTQEYNIKMNSLSAINDDLEEQVSKLLLDLSALKKSVLDPKAENNVGQVYNISNYVIENNKLNRKNIDLTARLAAQEEIIRKQEEELKRYRDNKNSNKIKGFLTDADLALIGTDYPIIISLIAQYSLMFINTQQHLAIEVETNILRLIMKLFKSEEDIKPYLDQLMGIMKQLTHKVDFEEIKKNTTYKSPDYNNFMTIVKIYDKVHKYNSVRDNLVNTVGFIRYNLTQLMELTPEDVDRLVGYFEDYLKD